MVKLYYPYTRQLSLFTVSMIVVRDRADEPGMGRQRSKRAGWGALANISLRAKECGARLPLLAKSGDNFAAAFEFVIVAEVDDVVGAEAATSLATQAFGMDRKQNRLTLNHHVRIVDRGLDRIDGEIGRNVAGLHLDAEHARGTGIDPNGASVGRDHTLGGN
jgi:hypothetical protein